MAGKRIHIITLPLKPDHRLVSFQSDEYGAASLSA